MKQKPIPPALTPFLEGKVLLIDKPLNWTSFDMVKKVRWLTKIMKVGHAGTLDPLATGLLIICTGKFTKQINEFMGMQKEYSGSLVLGATTASYDLEQEPEHFKPIDTITPLAIQEATKQFIGTILQMPPQHSAIKKDGVQLGVIAQELQAVLPECVKQESTGVLSVDADNLTWYMINAIKELKAEFDAYKLTHP